MSHFLRFNGFGFLGLCLILSCGDGGKAEAERALQDSIAKVEQIRLEDSIAMVAATSIDTGRMLMHVRYLDFEIEEELRIVVKDDSGNMRKFFIDATMPATEWKSIQKPENRGEWMLLEFEDREKLPDNDSMPSKWIREVTKMKMLGK